MGDRTWWDESCPKCGKEIEVYDAPSSLIWNRYCGNCGWSDGLNYYETSENEIVLCTKEQLQEMIDEDPAIKKFREKIDKWNEEIDKQFA